MKAVKIADKIMIFLVKQFVETGHEYTSLDILCDLFPDEPRHMVVAAINMLRDDDLLEAQDSDDEPNAICLCIASVKKVEENTVIRKGYAFLKEVRQLL